MMAGYVTFGAGAAGAVPGIDNDPLIHFNPTI